MQVEGRTESQAAALREVTDSKRVLSGKDDWSKSSLNW